MLCGTWNVLGAFTRLMVLVPMAQTTDLLRALQTVPQWSQLLSATGQLWFTEYGRSGAGCKVAQKAENKNLWRSGSLLWELGSRELKIADVLLFYPGSRVACVLWSVNNYSSWHDFSSICFLLITDEWLENSAQGCERAVQRLTKTGGYLEFSQKKKKTVSEAVQMLMPSHDLLYWATVQTLLGQEFFNFNHPIDILYIYLLLFKCFK